MGTVSVFIFSGACSRFPGANSTVKIIVALKRPTFVNTFTEFLPQNGSRFSSMHN